MGRDSCELKMAGKEPYFFARALDFIDLFDDADLSREGKRDFFNT